LGAAVVGATGGAVVVGALVDVVGALVDGVTVVVLVGVPGASGVCVPPGASPGVHAPVTARSAATPSIAPDRLKVLPIVLFVMASSVP
jgi:hypothetical protein